ncbi:MAG: SDR family NAD(P)-dependent oxidoreductase [Alphaproteobacteria bacterium]
MPPGILDRFRLDGRTALVTGASRNIGAAISRALAEAGARVVVNARGADALEALAERLRRDVGAEVIAVPGDLADPEQVERVARIVDDRTGGADVLVNNATSIGHARPATSLDSTPADVALAMQVNLQAPLALVRAFAPTMRARGRGTIVNVLSTAGFDVVPPMLAYACAKQALWTATRFLARELAPEIRVNAVCPGTVNEGGELKVPTWSKLLPLNALPRVGLPEEVAGAVVFLASEASSYTTGQVVFCDGGRVST